MIERKTTGEQSNRPIDPPYLNTCRILAMTTVLFVPVYATWNNAMYGIIDFRFFLYSTYAIEFCCIILWVVFREKSGTRLSGSGESPEPNYGGFYVLVVIILLLLSWSLMPVHHI